MTKKLSIALMALTASLALPQAALAADPAAGRALAEKWCVKCHNIEKGGPFKLRPPSFASIAVYRAEHDIHGKIISPHIGMPEILWVLRPEEIEDIVAYITSLDAK